MAISFNSLSWSASLTSIYDQAGRIFEEQVMNDTGTDYTDPEAFNTAIWYIAEKARDRGFSALQGMSIRDIASGIGNRISAYWSRHGSFSFLPRNASLTSIYYQAGRIFEEQIMNDVRTDYTRKEAYNIAIWFIAEKARRYGFSELQDMSTRDIASGIGNHLSAYLKAENPDSVAPVILGFLVGASLGGIGLTAIFAPHLLAVFAMKGAAIVHAHPQLTAKVLIRAVQAVLEGQSPAEVARSVSISTGAAIATPLLQDWLAGLKIH